MPRRTDFTIALGRLLVEMALEGEYPILDYVKRATEEQQRLFAIGRRFNDEGEVIAVDNDRKVTNCDGVHKTSDHQYALAADIFFEDPNDRDLELDAPFKGWNYWHDRWTALGGAPMIPWDKGHFAWPRG